MCFRSRAISIINLDEDDVNGDNNYVAVDEYVAEDNDDDEQWWVNEFYPYVNALSLYYLTTT